jgi:CheY-like chemotaxis protein
VAPPVNILLVEDNPDEVALAMRALRHARLGNGIEVVWDGAEALEVLFGPGIEEARPWLILLDLYLLKVDGLEVLRCLRVDFAKLVQAVEEVGFSWRLTDHL